MVRYEWNKLSRSSAFWIICMTLMIFHILLYLFVPVETTQSISAEEYRAELIRVIGEAKWNLEDYQRYGDGYLVRYQEKVIETYQNLLDANISPSVVKGWDIYFSNQKYDLLWMLCAVFSGVHLVMLERNHGMYILNHLTLGRKKMFRAKAILFFILSLCITIVFTAISLILIAIRFDFSSLDTPLCSIRDFQYCPYPITVGLYLLISFLIKTIQFFVLTLIGANLAKLFSGYLLSLFSGFCILGFGYVYEWRTFSFFFERYRAINLFSVPVSAVGCVCCVIIGILSVLLICFLSYFSKYILKHFSYQKMRILAFRQVKKHTLFWYEAKKLLGSVKVIILIFAILICKIGYGFWSSPKTDITEELYKELCFSLAGEATEEKYAYIQSELANTSEILEQKENMFFALQSGEIDREAFDEYLQVYYNAEHRNVTLLRLEEQYLRAASVNGDILYDSGWLLFFSIPSIDIFQIFLLITLCFSCYGFEHKNLAHQLLQTTINGKKVFLIKHYILYLSTLLVYFIFFAIDILFIVTKFPISNGEFSFNSLGILNISISFTQATMLFAMLRLSILLILLFILIKYTEKTVFGR